MIQLEGEDELELKAGFGGQWKEVVKQAKKHKLP